MAQSVRSFTGPALHCAGLRRAMEPGDLVPKDKARKWYDKAAEWMDKNKPDDEELRRFRAEAAGLMGVPEPVKAKEGALQNP